MRKYIFSVLIALLSLPVIAQQQSQAKVILDKTAEAFRKAGGVKADFTVKAVTNGLVEGAENGTIQLKGEKFVLKTSDIITWFDGKTQWSYVTKNDEVNVSNPTQEELQQINPYTFLYMYQKGFSYKLGATKMYRGKAVWEVVLTARDKKQELERITLFVTKDTYEPLYILLQQRGVSRRQARTWVSSSTARLVGTRLFNRASLSTLSRRIMPFFSSSCRMPVAVERLRPKTLSMSF